jgi:hypothetical protein
LEGQISFGGIHDVLESVSRYKNVTNGLLRITSNNASGLMGIFCGRFITGAVLILSGEEGYGALKQLLSAKDGTFAFMDAMGEALPDLRQSLGVDISLLLASVDLDNADLTLTEETLTGHRASQDELQLIDTSMDIGTSELLLTDGERVDRINRTYDRLMSLSQHQKAHQTANQPQPAPGPAIQAASTQNAASITPIGPLPHPGSYQPPSTADEKEPTFSRLRVRSGQDNAKVIGTIIAMAVAAAIGYVLLIMAPKILGH